MKITRMFFVLVLAVTSYSCFSQVDKLVFFDLSSNNATKTTDTWIDYSKTLTSDSYRVNYIHYLHNGDSPVISKYDSWQDVLSEMKLVRKSRPNAVDELRRIITELDGYEMQTIVNLEVLSSSDVFFSNDRLLYQRLKLILEQSGTEVKLVYHIPESEKDSAEELTKGKSNKNYQIKYF